MESILGIWVNNDAPYKYYHFWGFTSQLIIVKKKYGRGKNWQSLTMK